MKFNVFPNYKVLIQYIVYDNYDTYIENIGWISTPSIQQLKADMEHNEKLIGNGIIYKEYR